MTDVVERWVKIIGELEIEECKMREVWAGQSWELIK